MNNAQGHFGKIFCFVMNLREKKQSNIGVLSLFSKFKIWLVETGNQPFVSSFGLW